MVHSAVAVGTDRGTGARQTALFYFEAAFIHVKVILSSAIRFTHTLDDIDIWLTLAGFYPVLGCRESCRWGEPFRLASSFYTVA